MVPDYIMRVLLIISFPGIKKHSLLFSFFLFLLFFNCLAQNPIPPIEHWREHLNYQNTIQVVKGDRIYCATNTHFFSLDNSGNLNRYSKVSGLNDMGVQAISWDTATQQLVVAYTNTNVDVVKNNTIRNIGDIKRSSITGNKSLYSIYCKDGLAYVSSGLGIIVINLSKYEIKDTWFIGNNGGQVKVNAVTSDGQLLYAATEEGLKTAALNTSDISNYTNWKNLSGQSGLSNGSVKNILYTNGKIVAEKNDSLFLLNGNSWSLLYGDISWPITGITSSENKLTVCQRNISGNARVLVLNTTGIIEKNISQSGVISFPRSAILDNGLVWIADQFGGLSKFGNSFERFIPNGPPGTADGEMVVQNNTLYAAAGSVNSAWNYQYNRNGIFYYQDNLWSYQGFYNQPVLDSVLDFISVAIDPVNKSIWAGSYGGGLVNFQTNTPPKIFKKNNSTLQPTIGDPGSFRISGLAFDRSNNLWISNYGAPQNLQVKKADDTWKAITIPFTHIENAVGQILIDDLNQIWILSPKDNGVFCYNYGQSIDNLSDDKWKFYRQGSGNGNLPSNNVLSLLKDKNGFIWVGTDRGIGIIQCNLDVFSAQGCDAILPVVQLDRFAGLLFKDESVQCMALDGANRKWIGTKNGLWLLSAEGDKIIYRFTEENSPLLNNDVKKLAVNPVTGEVFVSTLNGICSFISTATEGSKTNADVLVFPNPVPPGYSGTIAIRGLVENALVKIAELGGKLIFQTRALGGQAIWDGHNYRGEKIASGVYLVIVRDDSGNEKIVTKIVITSGR